MRQELYFAQKAFITRDRHLLLVRKSAEDPNQAGLWEVPGGRMVFGEDVDAHIKREVREEVGLEITPGSPFHIWQWRLNRPGPKGLMTEWQIVAVARFCEATSGKVSVEGRVDDDYLGEIAWVPYDQLVRYQFIGNMMPVIESFLLLVNAKAHPQ